MRVFILTLGTRGDFELFCTLGRELSGRGHHVSSALRGSAHVRAADRMPLSAKVRTPSRGTALFRKRRRQGSACLRSPRWPARSWRSRPISTQRRQRQRLLHQQPRSLCNAATMFCPSSCPTIRRQRGEFMHYGSAARKKHPRAGGHEPRLVDPGRGWPGEFRFTGFAEEGFHRRSWRTSARTPPVVMTMAPWSPSMSGWRSLPKRCDCRVSVECWWRLSDCPLQSADESARHGKPTMSGCSRAPRVVHHGGWVRRRQCCEPGASPCFPDRQSRRVRRMLLRETSRPACSIPRRWIPGAGGGHPACR
jgi:hypothetical protein